MNVIFLNRMLILGLTLLVMVSVGAVEAEAVSFYKQNEDRYEN